MVHRGLGHTEVRALSPRKRTESSCLPHEQPNEHKPIVHQFYTNSLVGGWRLEQGLMIGFYFLDNIVISEIDIDIFLGLEMLGLPLYTRTRMKGENE